MGICLTRSQSRADYTSVTDPKACCVLGQSSTLARIHMHSISLPCCRQGGVDNTPMGRATASHSICMSVRCTPSGMDGVHSFGTQREITARHAMAKGDLKGLGMGMYSFGAAQTLSLRVSGTQ